MNRQGSTSSGDIGTVAALIVAAVVSCVLNGWALSVLWGWFIIGAFELPKLSISNAIGVSFVVSFLLTKSSDFKPEATHEDLVNKFALILIYPFFAVVVGWIVNVVVG